MYFDWVKLVVDLMCGVYFGFEVIFDIVYVVWLVD